MPPQSQAALTTHYFAAPGFPAQIPQPRHVRQRVVHGTRHEVDQREVGVSRKSGDFVHRVCLVSAVEEQVVELDVVPVPPDVLAVRVEAVERVGRGKVGEKLIPVGT